ncbi:MAG TPA: SPFH domain-containing protein [Myxococcaceae bacterium]|nr:SPFH domain-containing protein [Myxococcaceae bacterium]
MRPLLWLLLLSLPLAGCTCHSTHSTEVGVLTRRAALGGLLGKPGVQAEVYAPGATYLFPIFLTDWHTFDVSLQNLSMVRDAKKGADRSHEDDLFFKTIDGNDIRVDVTVAWAVDPKRAPYLLTKVGESTEQVKEKLVRPACRSIVRDVLNSLRSEEFYVSEKRFAKAAEARDRLAAVLEPEGIMVRQVILGEHHFNPEYEKVIRDKKLAEQNSERMRSEARASGEQMKSELQKAKGSVNQTLAAAQGALDTAKLSADAQLFQNQKQAEALVAEKKAHAQGVRKQNEALAGSGGAALVKLKIAEALAGKDLVFLPGGKSGVGLQTLNVNQLLQAITAQQAVQPTAPPEEKPQERAH